MSWNGPLVSVVITNYNMARFLPEAIRSVLDQTYRHFEIIVVDDGSTDDSREIIIGHGDSIVSAFHPTNRGLGAAMNTGIRIARGELVCFLDADDLLLPGKLATVVRVFSTHPRASWCFHIVRVQEMSTGRVIRHTPGRFCGYCDLRNAMTRGIGRFGTYGSPPTGGLCFRKQFLDELIPIPEVPHRYHLNDSYLRFAAWALSPGVLLNDTLCILRVHDGNSFTGNPGCDTANARRQLMTGYWLSQRFPAIVRSCDRLIARGLAFSLLYPPRDREAWDLGLQYVRERPLHRRLIIRFLVGCCGIRAILRGRNARYRYLRCDIEGDGPSHRASART